MCIVTHSELLFPTKELLKVQEMSAQTVVTYPSLVWESLTRYEGKELARSPDIPTEQYMHLKWIKLVR